MGSTPRDLFVSEDGGDNWTIVTSDRPSAYPKDQLRVAKFDMPSWIEDYIYSMSGGIQFAPTSSEAKTEIWLSTGFGVLRANDLMSEPVIFNGNQAMNGLEELVITQVEGLPSGSLGEFATVVMDQSAFIFKDDGSIPLSKASTLPIANGTGIGFAYQDPQSIYFVGGTHHYEVPFASISTDGGETYSPLNPPSEDTFAGNIAVSAEDPKNIVWIPADNDSYPGIHPPMHTYNGGKTWAPVLGLPPASNPISNPYFHSKVIAADTVNSETFYYYDQFRKEAKLYRSTDGGRSFNVVNENLRTHWKVNLKAAPNVEGEVWLGLPEKGLWFSSDGGETFVEVTGFSDLKAFGLGAPLPGRTKYTVYVVAKMNDRWGIFYSSDLGNSWSVFNTENKVPLFGATSIGASLQNPGRVMVGTSGRGLFRGDLPLE